MAQPDDFTPRKKQVNNDLSATVPDIFAAMGDDEIPQEFTVMELETAGNLKVPGDWELVSKPNRISQTTSYKRNDSISSAIAICPFQLDQRGATTIKNLCTSEARTLQDFELAGLLSVLSESRRPNEYEITAGSIELLCDKIILVIQGYFKNEAMREALIVFPIGRGYGLLSLKAIKPEFPTYFNHLRHALQTIEWKS